MNIEELKKIVRGNGFQESHGSTTIVIDVETVIDLIDEYKAINYTRCCESDSEQLCDHIYFDNTQKPDNCIYCNYKREPK